MFTLSYDSLHKDWYKDGVEDDEECWRLDLDDDIQVQIFAQVVQLRPYGANYVPLRLFIERDTRIGAESVDRVHYACQTWSLTDVDAYCFLTWGKKKVGVLLSGKIKEVMALPNDPKYGPQELVQPRLFAEYRRQKWWNNYALPVGDPEPFDATEPLLRVFTAEQIRSFKFNDYDSDRLAEWLNIGSDHFGPDEVDIDENEWNQFWLDNGVEDSHQLTDDQLTAIRCRYGYRCSKR